MSAEQGSQGPETDKDKAESMAYVGKELMDQALAGEAQAQALHSAAEDAAERAETQSAIRQKLVKMVTREDDVEFGDRMSQMASSEENLADRRRGEAAIAMEREGQIYDLLQKGVSREDAEAATPHDIEEITRVLNKWSKRHAEEGLAIAEKGLAKSQAALEEFDSKGEPRTFIGAQKRRNLEQDIAIRNQEIALFNTILGRFQ